MKVGRKAKKVRLDKPLLETLSEDGNNSFARALGSVDFHTRDRGLQALTVFLSRRTSLEPLEMRKIWKGLFYCFWHSDKAPVQEQLATRLAAVLPRLHEEVAALYFEIFLETMQREWFGIDRLRLDKFLMLVRKFVRQLFVHLQACEWDSMMLGRYAALLQALLQRSNEQTAAGLCFQITDAVVPELLEVLEESGSSIPDAALRQVLAVFIHAISTSSRASLPPRIREGVFKPLLEELQPPSKSGPLQECDIASLAGAISDTGADPRVKTKAREILYELSSSLERLSSKKRKKEPTDCKGGEDTLDGPGPAEKDDHTEAPQPKKQRKKGAEERLDSMPADPAEEGLRADAAGHQKGHLAEQPGGRRRQSPNHTEDAQKGTEEKTTAAADLTLSRLRLPKIKMQQAARPASSVNATPSPSITTPQLVAGGSPVVQNEDPKPSMLRATAGGNLEAVGPPAMQKKAKMAKGLASEAITRAAERTLAAINAHKKGQATVHPATPGSPSEVSSDSWFKESLESEKRQGSSPQTSPSSRPRTAGGTPLASGSPRDTAVQQHQGFVTRQLSRLGRKQPPAGTPGSYKTPDCERASRASSGDGATPDTNGSAKHVRFALKRNLYFMKGQPPHPTAIRTPDACRPKGSALKKGGEFQRPIQSVQPPHSAPVAQKPKKKKSRLGLRLPQSLAGLLNTI